MILRIVLGTLPPGRDAATLVAARNRLARAAGAVAGLDSLILAARPVTTDDAGVGPDALPTIDGAVVTVWQDPGTMARAVEGDDEGRFLGPRLDLPFRVTAAGRDGVFGRTCAALPPESTAFRRMLTVRSDAGQESRLMDILRAQQPRMVDLGIVASHLGRRLLPDGDVEA